MSCPNGVEAYRSAKHGAYVFVFGSPVRQQATMRVALYGDRGTYRVEIPDVKIDVPTTYAFAEFRSKAYLVAAPDDRHVYGATSIATSLADCPVDGSLFGPPHDLPSHLNRLSLAQQAIYDAINDEIATATPLPVDASPAEHFDCKSPWRNPSVVTFGQQRVPVGVSFNAGYMAPVVLADVDRTGSLKSASVYLTSGSDLIDGAALKVAETSHYAPGAAACAPVGAQIIFSVGQNYRPYFDPEDYHGYP